MTYSDFSLNLSNLIK